MFDSEQMVLKIKQLCKENSIKVCDLENAVGLSKGNISRWAKSCPSSIIALSQMANILNTSVDYILSTDHDNNAESGKSTTLNNLIKETEGRGVEWVKIPYSKSKKIPVIKCINDYIYEKIFAYETNFLNQHLIFVCYDETQICELYIENNNEYIIICNNDSYSKRLRIAIDSLKQKIANDFFNM